MTSFPWAKSTLLPPSPKKDYQPTLLVLTDSKYTPSFSIFSSHLYSCLTHRAIMKYLMTHFNIIAAYSKEQFWLFWNSYWQKSCQSHLLSLSYRPYQVQVVYLIKLLTILQICLTRTLACMNLTNSTLVVQDLASVFRSSQTFCRRLIRFHFDSQNESVFVLLEWFVTVLY